MRVWGVYAFLRVFAAAAQCFLVDGCGHQSVESVEWAEIGGGRTCGDVGDEGQINLTPPKPALPLLSVVRMFE